MLSDYKTDRCICVFRDCDTNDLSYTYAKFLQNTSKTLNVAKMTSDQHDNKAVSYVINSAACSNIVIYVHLKKHIYSFSSLFCKWGKIIHHMIKKYLSCGFFGFLCFVCVCVFIQGPDFEDNKFYLRTYDRQTGRWHHRYISTVYTGIFSKRIKP